jgi:hypothetical protein
MSTLEPIFDASDWHFVNEGGRHTIYRYCASSSSPQSVFVGKVIRVRKFEQVRSNSTEQQQQAGCNTSHFLESYEENVNEVLYPPGANNARLQSIFFQVEYGFIKKLHERHMGVVDGVSPSAADQGIDAKDHYVCEIMPNVMEVFKPAQPTTIAHASVHNKHNYFAAKVLTVEIKIKGAHPSVSTFLSPQESGIKHKYGRYHMKQLASAAKMLTIDDEGAQSQKPAVLLQRALLHDPRDLLSLDKSLVRDALQKLVKSPGNVLRGHINGHRHILCAKENDRSKDWWRKVCSAFVSNSIVRDGEDIAALGDTILDAVSSILCEETVLRDISVVQKFDFIDIEGATLIFDHLSLLLGSKDAAERALCESVLQASQVIEVVKRCVGENTDIFTGDLPTFIKPFLFGQKNGDDDDVRACTGEISKEELISKLTVSESCILLNMWLISLAAKDSSVMVSMRVQSVKRVSTSCAFGSLICKGVHSQTSDHCGHVILVCPASCAHCSEQARSEVCLLFSSALVDIGYKDPAKCWQKSEEEKRLVANAALFLAKVAEDR